MKKTKDYTKTARVLVVDDDLDVLQAAKLFLKQHVGLVQTESDPLKIPDILANSRFDIVLLDMNFTKDITSGQEGLYWLSKIQEIDSSLVVILITAFGEIDIAVKVIKAGAYDFIIKPWQNQKLLATISATMNLRYSRLEIENLRSQQQLLSADLDLPFHNFLGDSQGMLEVFNIITKVAPTDANILILGENGTGKELAARALHRQSERDDKVFIKVDMGSISETLFESELFGHVKGAFTDAKDSRPGRFEIASGGTLFLDEIGNLPLSLQTKLLTVLQNREVIRVGSNKAVTIDIRLICASNTSLHEMAEQNMFREDLLYRIKTVELTLPPLRERIDDIPQLVDHFLRFYNNKYRKEITHLNPASISKLKRYKWPGNVRELQHALERAVIMSNNRILQPEDFQLSPSNRKSGETVLENYNLEDVEKILIRKVLTKNDGNISNTANELGLTRASLYRRMKKYDL